MRLDARKGDVDWSVYDAKRCCMVKHVVWLDDETATWAELVIVKRRPFLELILRQEDRITIYPSRRLVIFNGIDGVEDEQVRDEQPIGVPA
jgi:hypothetical protein